jgi:hypothetical protein
MNHIILIIQIKKGDYSSADTAWSVYPFLLSNEGNGA